MVIIIDTNLSKHLKELNIKKRTELKKSILIGSRNITENKLSIFSVVHFKKTDENELTSLTISDEELNQFKTLKYMLPYLLEIVGIIFYTDKEITDFTIKSCCNKLLTICPITLILIQLPEKTIYYQIINNKLQEIKIQEESISIENMLSFIYTLEFEAPNEVLKNQSELKKTLYSGIDLHWDKTQFNVNENNSIITLQMKKNPIERIIELMIPSEDKKLTNKTETGKIFLAYDLHMNFYIPTDIKSKKLNEIKPIIKDALKQDLLIKLQRSTFDENDKRLKTPDKISLKFFGIELNTYLSKENPSKYEYDLCNSLIKHADIMALFGFTLQSRILLRDL